MVSFSPREKVQALREKLEAMSGAFEEVEIEKLVLWRDVEERLHRAGLEYHTAYQPDGMPPEQV
jgi:hypothetical protein